MIGCASWILRVLPASGLAWLRVTTALGARQQCGETLTVTCGIGWAVHDMGSAAVETAAASARCATYTAVGACRRCSDIQMWRYCEGVRVAGGVCGGVDALYVCVCVCVCV